MICASSITSWAFGDVVPIPTFPVKTFNPFVTFNPPVIFTFPTTVNVCPGVEVPIPTLSPPFLK